MRRLLAVIAAAFLLAGAGHAQAPPAAHLGSGVIMIRYEGAWPNIVGTEAAAVIVDGPFACPAGHPHEGGECANLRFLTRSPADGENGDLLHYTLGEGPEGYVLTGMDWRSAVWHDPTGQALRSWRLFGEGPSDLEGAPRRLTNAEARALEPYRSDWSRAYGIR